MPLPGESYFLALAPNPKPFVSLGLPFDVSCVHHATNTFHASRIYLIVSRSISHANPAFTALRTALGDKLVGIRHGIRQHVPWPDVLEVTSDLDRLSADLIITLGAGSLTDGAKVATFAAANKAFTLGALDRLHIRWGDDGKTEKKPVTIPTINIPTSLSGGEYNSPGGATDLRNGIKSSFQHPSIGAQLVILDPALTVSTPEKVWLSSGMRAVDHCVEGLTSIGLREGGRGNEKVEGYCVKGLRLLLPNLLVTKNNPGDLETRRSEMLGVIEAFRGLTSGVLPMGASHGIGHQLGPLGVGHGETSCVMLPSVLRWNLKNAAGGEEREWVEERQRKVLDVFWGDATVAEALEQRGLSRETAGAGDVVGAFVAALGLPTTLKEVGIGRDKLEGLAKNTMTDRCIPTNPVAIDNEGQLLEILELALGDGSGAHSAFPLQNAE
ncbi:putative Fe-containing alcohol dehydrogenase [Apiosordaria backusii]|uniref:Fe-containing alcohol dehydrogenase n=1 Tax=Apiosordaria backusii TaxID=314023 RepID=A0AA40ESN9_9PEZI|nr:putative Fe-containing alcohol dehydrogenase [Apiosordaria backusii]